MNARNIFDAIKRGDAGEVSACIAAGANLAAVNDWGFTALQAAAMGTHNLTATQHTAMLDILRMLIDAGSPLEARGPSGGTALYYAAEFASDVAHVQILLDAGAEADISDVCGNHIMTNAFSDEVIALLAHVTGRSVPVKQPEPDPVRMTAGQWRAAKTRLDTLFATLEQEGLIALQDAGDTQSDAFTSCSERFHQRNGEKTGIQGFCFYTRQDQNRAKRTSYLSLGFWGAPEGAEADLLRVGTLITDCCNKCGFEVRWNGSASTRPEVSLL